MSDLPTHDGAEQPRGDVGAARERRTPGWVKALAIVVLVLLVLLLASRLFGIEHGPDLHSSSLMADRLAFVHAFNAA